MPRHNSRKTRTRKQAGGAAAAYASVSNTDNDYTPKDVEEFFNEILKKSKHGYFANFGILSKEFFELKPGARHVLQIKSKWTKMVNECLNSRGQTPLYFALRFEAENEMTDMLLNTITDVNRPNRDGSTPLIGLCFGSNESAHINFLYVTNMINKLCATYNANLNIANGKGEKPMDILKFKVDNNYVKFA
jgi:hypothetical protein